MRGYSLNGRDFTDSHEDSNIDYKRSFKKNNIFDQICFSGSWHQERNKKHKQLNLFKDQ